MVRETGEDLRVGLKRRCRSGCMHGSFQGNVCSKGIAVQAEDP